MIRITNLTENVQHNVDHFSALTLDMLYLAVTNNITPETVDFKRRISGVVFYRDQFEKETDLCFTMHDFLSRDALRYKPLEAFLHALAGEDEVLDMLRENSGYDHLLTDALSTQSSDM